MNFFGVKKKPNYDFCPGFFPNLFLGSFSEGGAIDILLNILSIKISMGGGGISPLTKIGTKGPTKIWLMLIFRQLLIALS